MKDVSKDFVGGIKIRNLSFLKSGNANQASIQAHNETS